MYVVKRLGLLGAGFVVGCGVGWSLDDSLIWDIRIRLGYSPFTDPDYLRLPTSDLPLAEKRKEFAHLLSTKGPSPHFSLLISEFSKHAFLVRAEKDAETLTRKEETEVMEALMRKEYPELFDASSGREFIASLNLKLYCEDHYQVPKFLRPVR